MNIKYITRILGGAKFKNLNRVINDIHKKTEKNRVGLFFDIAGCSLKYGAGYNDYNIFEFYNMTAKERKTYMTRVKNNKFISMVNDAELSNIFDQKNLFDEKFKDFLGREVLDLAKIDYDDFVKFIDGKEYFFAKPYIGESGKGIEKIKVSDFADTKTLYEYVTNKDKNFGLIEEVIVQHPDVERIYPYSLNCLRIVTLVKDGVPHILYAIFKTGNNGNFVDNLENGGLACHFDLDKGEIVGRGHSSGLETFDAHPATGIKFVGYKLPYINEVKELVKRAALVIPEFGYVGWDVCITPNGPAIVEGNDFPAYDFPQLPDPDRPKIGLRAKINELGFNI